MPDQEDFKFGHSSCKFRNIEDTFFTKFILSILGVINNLTITLESTFLYTITRLSLIGEKDKLAWWMYSSLSLDDRRSTPIIVFHLYVKGGKLFGNIWMILPRNKNMPFDLQAHISKVGLCMFILKRT